MSWPFNVDVDDRDIATMMPEGEDYLGSRASINDFCVSFLFNLFDSYLNF
jgi:hypothetical protein